MGFNTHAGVVTTTADSGAGSLRQVIIDAVSPETITFNAGLNGGTITLAGTELATSKSLTIDASALSKGITISGNQASRVLFMGGTSVTLNNLTITGGNTTGNGGGIQYTTGTLTMIDCTVSSCNAVIRGGGIYTSGTLNLVRSTISNNSATNIGGGICTDTPAVTLTNSTVAGNISANDGGGIFSFGPLNLESTTISGNQGLRGGGIFGQVSTLQIKNTIIAGNSATNTATDVFFLAGTTTSQGGNLIGDNNGGATQFPAGNPNLNNDIAGTVGAKIAPLLSLLGNNGGKTQTLRPLPGSPAINAAVTTVLATDQRGYARVVGVKADSGSVEAGPTVTVTNTNDAGAGSLRNAIDTAAADTSIVFAAGLSGTQITLSTGQLLVDSQLTIDASSLADGITISANNSSRVFEVATGTLAAMNSLTITQGNVAAGAGLLNQGTLTINNSTFTANGGGAISNLNGTLALNNSTLSGNTTANNGAGILNNNAVLALNHTTVSANTAGLAGGGIYRTSGTITLNNSIVAGNTATTDSNVFGSFSGANNLTSGDPKLTSLADYGGASRTMQPRGGSPAIDAAGSSSLTVDQRGAIRPVGAAKDIGSVEVTTTGVSPAELATTATVRPTLSWTAPGASSSQLFLGTVSNALVSQGTQVSPFTVTTSLLPATTYYWRVDTTYNGSVISGTIYSFTTRPKNLVVDSLSDDNDGITLNGISLRDALLEVVGTTPPEVISFAPALNGQTITLGGNFLTITKSMGIDASSLPDGITIDANGAVTGHRVFHVSGGVLDVVFTGLTITGGVVNGSGGGIQNDGNLSLIDCTIHDCSVTVNGGGVSNNGALTMLRSTIHDNQAGNLGAGVLNNSGNLTITNSTLAGNTAANSGGAIFNFGTLVLSSSTIYANTASAGGAIQTQGGSAQFKNTILAGNNAPSDANLGVSGTTITTLGGNLLGTQSTFTNQFPVGYPNANLDIVGANASPIDPSLAPLARNGGPTPTLSLLPGSPAVDAGVATTLLTDQRGAERVLADGPDIGAFETAASDYSLSGLVLHATINPALTSMGVRFEISTDPNFLPSVTTLAGSGAQALTDGTVSGAAFNNPTGVAQDAVGNLFIADAGNNTIRMISPAGVVTTIAGTGGFGFANGPGTSATFAIPGALAVGPDNNLYVSDILNHCIRKLSRPVTNGLPWTVTTLVGSGTAGFSDGTGSAAKFSAPHGLAFDSAGRLYVADSGNHRIRRITVNDRIVETFAGTGTPGASDVTRTAATFNTPFGVVFDSAGNLYIADRDNHRIRKINTSGIVSTLAGSTAGAANGTGAAAQFNRPIGLAADALGNLYVADENNHSIRKVTTPAALVSTVAGLGTSGMVNGSSNFARFNGPTSLIVDLHGHLIVADAKNHRLRKIVVNAILVPAVVNGGNLTATIDAAALGLDPNTVYYFRWRSLSDQSTQPLGQSFYLLDAPGVTTTAATGITRSAATLNAAVDPQGSATTVTFEYSTDPNLEGPLKVEPAGSGINDPHGMAVDGEGNLYIADRGAHRILKRTPEGAMILFAGDGTPGFVDGPGNTARFDHPSDIAVDVAGNLYVADELNHRIRKITPGGNVTTIAGSNIAGFADAPVATNGQLLFPTGVAVDAAGANIYIADRGNQRIRLISGSALYTLAGNGTAGYVQGVATSAQFRNPTGVTVDALGNVYVADSDNHCVRLISGGTVSTAAGTGIAGFLDGDAGIAQFSHPSDVAVDLDGRVLVADRDNHRLRRIHDGQVITLAGSGTPGILDSPSSGFLYPATAAQFSSPTNVTTGGYDGAIYLTEQGDGIRRISRDAPPAITLPQTFNAIDAVNVGIALPKTLLADTTYYFRASATNGRNPTQPIFGEILSFTTPTDPVIAVFNGAGATSPQLESGQSVDFGLTPRGTPITRFFKITNQGEWDLTIGPIFSTPDVQITGGTGVVPAGASLAFQVTVDASAGGNFNRLVTIGCDDPDQGIFYIPITWIVRNPPTVVTAPATDVGNGIATLNATVNPEASTTTVSFAYSRDPNIDGVEVTTVAGSSAGFNGPTAIATDASGNIYVADELNHRIRKITPAGVTTTVAGNGTAGSENGPVASARFSGPAGIAVGSDGTLYVSDSGNHRIRAISSDGQVTTHSGLGLSGFTEGDPSAARFSNPGALAIAADNTLYLADRGNRRVRKISPSGVVSTLAGSGLNGSLNGSTESARFTDLRGIAVSDGGVVYITESGFGHIRRIAPNGTVDTFIASGLSDPWGIALADNGNLFVADGSSLRIRKVTPLGVVTSYAGSGSPGTTDGLGPVAQFNTPVSVAVSPSGDVIVGEIINNTIRRITPTTVIVEVATDLTGTATVPVSMPLTGLVPGATYYYRAIATNDGGTTLGNIVSFTAVEGPFASWQLFHFGTDAGNPLIAGPAANPSKDGVSNLLKYAFGLDPNINSVAGLPESGFGGGFLTLTYTQVLAATDLVYTVEWSPDLNLWYSTGITQQGVGGDFTSNKIKASVSTGSNLAKFMRLKVTKANP
ncbi:MAG: choice-of-anchor Q domain-containing protein [Verrucomicrobiota bacterium]